MGNSQHSTQMTRLFLLLLPIPGALFAEIYPVHLSPDGTRRHCKEIACPLGTVPQLCRPGQPTTTSCQQCDGRHFFMNHMTSSLSGSYKCFNKRVCTDKKGLKIKRNNDNTQDRECECLLDHGYYDIHFDPSNPSTAAADCRYCPDRDHYVDRVKGCSRCQGKIVLDHYQYKRCELWDQDEQGKSTSLMSDPASTTIREPGLSQRPTGHEEQGKSPSPMSDSTTIREPGVSQRLTRHDGYRQVSTIICVVLLAAWTITMVLFFVMYLNKNIRKKGEEFQNDSAESRQSGEDLQLIKSSRSGEATSGEFYLHGPEELLEDSGTGNQIEASLQSLNDFVSLNRSTAATPSARDPPGSTFITINNITKIKVGREPLTVNNGGSTASFERSTAAEGIHCFDIDETGNDVFSDVSTVYSVTENTSIKP